MRQLNLFAPKRASKEALKTGRSPHTRRKVSYLGRWPKITLAGKWLTEMMGVKVGDYVDIEYKKTRIIIKLKKNNYKG